jgi:Fic family protein
MSKFLYHPIQLLKPDFDSQLTTMIIELDFLRKKILQGNTPSHIFFQLKTLYHVLESIYSARIEGNHTTIIKYLEQKVESKPSLDEKFREIANIEKCLQWIESIDKIEINQDFIKKIHTIITSDLVSEGDATPGIYRQDQVAIGKSEYLPPVPELVGELMSELENFILKGEQSKYDLIKMATIHHRFTWIHPFNNGNGRTVRALTFALLRKYGFIKSRIINPTAIFCKSRANYYKFLSIADSGDKSGLEKWVSYVLQGLKDEILKIDKLTEIDFVRSSLLIPVVQYNHKNSFLSDLERDILISCLQDDQCVLTAGVVKTSFASFKITRQIKKMLSNNLLINLSPRKYTINLAHPKLQTSLAYQLENLGFLPEKVDQV